jgi:hypothetical protein
MATLADLINPTFLMFLGILVLVVALLVVYIESKMRDQNHKIASMLSLVSTLAEDMNGVKMGLNQLAVTRMGGSFPQNFEQSLENQRIPYQESKLIEVSDDDDDEDDEDDDVIDIDEDIAIDEDDDEDDDDIDIDEDDNDEADEDEDSKHDVVKVLKMNMSAENNLELDELDDELYDELSQVQSLSSKSSKLSDKLEKSLKEDKTTESLNISSSDLKTISIKLEESQHDSLDYKKLSLPKLRSIVSEKGLASDTSKLKKNELLNLLGCE